MSWVPHPVEIRYVEEEELLRIRFSDDLEREYPAAYLRGYCPCAHCQGHGGGLPKFRPPTSEVQTTIEDVTPVGNYAICIVWADRHDTGIYSFERLRRMVPDPEFDAEAVEPETELTLSSV